MTRAELFGAWAPPDGIWSAWAKPVLFAYGEEDIAQPPAATISLQGIPAPRDALLIVDLPGFAAVAAGIELASRGYRPAPLFNACPSPLAQGIPAAAIVDVRPIIAGLRFGASALQQGRLRADAPPAFLLDADRRVGSGARPAAGMFDNRSISLPTDFPSANLILSRGIHRAILIQCNGVEPQADLTHTLAAWQLAGIRIEVLSNGTLMPITVRRPSIFRRLFQRTFATAGLIRNPLGGFGGTLPHSGTG